MGTPTTLLNAPLERVSEARVREDLRRRARGHSDSAHERDGVHRPENEVRGRRRGREGAGGVK